MLDAGIDYASQESTDDHGRLKRPWTVLVFGFLVSIASVIVADVEATGSRIIENTPATGIVCFGLLAFVLSILYVAIGTTIGRVAARRVVGTIGALLLLGGVG